MTIESNYVIAIATLQDWHRSLNASFSTKEKKTETIPILYTRFFPRLKQVTGISRNSDSLIALLAMIPVKSNRTVWAGNGNLKNKDLMATFTDPCVFFRGSINFHPSKIIWCSEFKLPLHDVLKVSPSSEWVWYCDGTSWTRLMGLTTRKNDSCRELGAGALQLWLESCPLQCSQSPVHFDGIMASSTGQAWLVPLKSN